MQGDSETVADDVCHLERAFHVVFGSDSLNWETKEAMLYVSIGRAHPRLASLLIVQQLKLEETPGLEKLDFSDILNQLTELLSLAISLNFRYNHCIMFCNLFTGHFLQFFCSSLLEFKLLPYCFYFLM